MSKLTLSVEKNVVARARRYAERQGTSISRLVETYLAAVAAPSADDIEDAPVLRRLRGSLRKADMADYHRHLAAKYR
jgi:hypothetical protein